MSKQIAGVWLCVAYTLLGLSGCGGGSVASSSTSTQTDIPVITSISPTSATVGSGAENISATGSNFTASSQIYWNGQALATSLGPPTVLSAQIPASDFATTGTAQVTVVTPGAGGGTSNVEIFSINNPIPTMSSLSPGSAPAGGLGFALTVTGTGFNSTSQVEWNGATLATSLVSSTQLTAQVPAADLTSPSAAQISVFNAAPGGGQSSGLTFYVNSGATRVRTISLNADDIVWDPANSQIYASVPGSSGPNSNSVVSVDPVTGSIGAPQPAGVNPDQMALSFDNSYLWVGEDGSQAIQRFRMPGLTPDITIPLPASGAITAGTSVLSMAAAPDNAHTLAASLLLYPGELYVYDDAVPRNGLPTGPGSLREIDFEGLQWGKDSSTLYVSTGVGEPNTSATLSVSSSGLSVNTFYGAVFGPSSGRIHYDPTDSYLYSDYGGVEDTATGALVGTANTSGGGTFTCIPDAANGVVYCAAQLAYPSSDQGYAIEVFDKTTYRLLRTLVLSGQTEGTPGTLIRWGSAGLALSAAPYPYPTTDGFSGAIYIIDGSFVNPSAGPASSTGVAVQQIPVLSSISAQSTTAGSGDVTLTVTGTNFEPGAIVSNGGTPFSTTFVNASELQAILPASLLSTPQALSIAVSNGDPTRRSVSVDEFTVLPAASDFIPVDLVARDVAWDNASGLLYAAVSSEDSQYPNSIVAIDPSTGHVVRSQFAGSDPYLVRTTADGNYLYAADTTSGAVMQFQLPSLAPVNSWNLGGEPSTALLAGSVYALDIQADPVASQTTAIAYGMRNITSPSAGIRIFDDSVSRPVHAAASLEKTMDYYDSLQWGSGGSLLYAANNENGQDDFYTMNVNASGVVLANDVPNAFPGSPANKFTHFLSDIHFDTGTGYIYDDDGQVLNPASGAQVGMYGTSGLAAPDSALNKVFILGQTAAQNGSDSYTIQSFDQKNFTALGSVTLSGIVGLPTKLVRWGSSGLAISTYNSYNDVSNQAFGMLYILNDATFVKGN